MATENIVLFIVLVSFVIGFAGAWRLCVLNRRERARLARCHLARVARLAERRRAFAAMKQQHKQSRALYE